jgi:SNF2 family DNA or RNA helicase
MIAQPFTPREYQIIARDFILENQRCNLFAQPGLGKTATVYSVLDILKLCGSSFFPALVIAPKRVVELPWPDEQKKWSTFHDMRVVSILGERDARDEALMAKGDVFLINYDNVQWLTKKFAGRPWPFRTVIADESTRLKNFRLNGGGARAKALSDIALHCGRWINLTGTPAPNGLKDLWGQMWFIDQGQRLGHSHAAFMRRWFFEDPYKKTVELRHPTCFPEIIDAIADVTLSLRAEDWFPIQKALEIPRYVDLPPEARKQYDQMENQLFTEIDGNPVEAVNSGVKTGKLLQMASGMVYDSEKVAHWVHDAKVEGLRSLVEELAGEPLLVAYWFKWEPPLLREAFPDIHVFKTKQDQDRWNAGKIPLMLLHPGSAGHGIDLQYGGRSIAHFTHTWDLELHDQINERIGPTRQLQAGFKRTVNHYNLIAKNTMDVEVIDRNIGKASVQSALMAARARRRGEDLI